MTPGEQASYEAATSVVWLGIVAVVHVVLAAVVWRSAVKVGARRGRLGYGFIDMGPGAWLLAVLVFGPWAASLWAGARASLHVLNVHEADQTESHPAVPPPAPPGVQPVLLGTWVCPTCGTARSRSDRFCGNDGTPRPGETPGRPPAGAAHVDLPPPRL